MSDKNELKDPESTRSSTIIEFKNNIRGSLPQNFTKIGEDLNAFGNNINDNFIEFGGALGNDLLNVGDEIINKANYYKNYTTTVITNQISDSV